MTAMRRYIAIVDGFNYRLGRIMMFGIFVLMAVLAWSTLSKVAFSPSLWTLEMAQFIMVGYYMLGGPYSIQMGSNVRMDLFYGEFSPRRKAWFDAFTVFFLLIYLGILLWAPLHVADQSHHVHRHHIDAASGSVRIVQGYHLSANRRAYPDPRRSGGRRCRMN